MFWGFVFLAGFSVLLGAIFWCIIKWARAKHAILSKEAGRRIFFDDREQDFRDRKFRKAAEKTFFGDLGARQNFVVKLLIFAVALAFAAILVILIIAPASKVR